METKIALFQRKEIRKTIHNDEWWFVITDVVAALTDSVDAADYLKKLRKRDEALSEAFKGGGQTVPPLADACAYGSRTTTEEGCTPRCAISPAMRRTTASHKASA